VFKLRHLAIVLPFATATLMGCGPEDMMDESTGSTAPQAPATEATQGGAEPTMGTATQELNSLGAYTWKSPADATSMGATADRACFLTRIQGDFATASNAVEIFGRLGSWYLRGSGNTGATGRCASLPAGTTFSAEYTLAAGQRLPTNMGTTTGRVCYLVRVAGSFNSGADWVRIYSSGGAWFLFADSTAGNVSAQARCVTTSALTGEYGWSSSQGHDTHLGTTSGRVCALTSMSGRFDSMSDNIHVYASAGSWYLGGGATSSSVSARARCF
jgi:hypothetical protein